MSLEEQPFYERPNCTPFCDHMQVCKKCSRARCVRNMRHSRLNGYECVCGSQEWRSLGTLRARDYPATDEDAAPETRP